MSVRVDDKYDFLDVEKTTTEVSAVIWGLGTNILVIIQPMREFDNWQRCFIYSNFRSCIRDQYQSYFHPGSDQVLRENSIIVWVDPEQFNSGLYYPSSFEKDNPEQDFTGIDNLIPAALLNGEKPETAISETLQVLADMQSNIVQDSLWLRNLLIMISTIITFLLIYLAITAALQARWWKANAGAVGAMSRQQRKKLLAAIREVHLRSTSVAKNKTIHSRTFTQFVRGVFATYHTPHQKLTALNKSRELSALAQLAWETLDEFQEEIALTDIPNLHLIEQAHENPAPALSTTENLGILPEAALREKENSDPTDPHTRGSILHKAQLNKQKFRDQQFSETEKSEQEKRGQENTKSAPRTTHKMFYISPSVILLSALIAISSAVGSAITARQDLQAEIQYESALITTQPDFLQDPTTTPLIERRGIKALRKVTALHFYDDADLFTNAEEQNLTDVIVGMPYGIDGEVFVITTKSKFENNPRYRTKIIFNEILMEEYPELYKLIANEPDSSEYQSYHYEFIDENPTVIVFADGGKQRFIDYAFALPDIETKDYYLNQWNPEDFVGDRNSGKPAEPVKSPSTTVWNAVSATSNLAREVENYESDPIQLVSGNETTKAVLSATLISFLGAFIIFTLISLPLRKYLKKKAEQTEIRSTLTILTLTADSLLLEGIQLDQLAPEAKFGAQIDAWLDRFTQLQPRLSDKTLAAEAGYSFSERLAEVRKLRDEAAQLWTLQEKIDNSQTGIGDQLLYVTARRIEHAPRVQSYFWLDTWASHVYQKIFATLKRIFKLCFRFFFNHTDKMLKRICKFAGAFFVLLCINNIFEASVFLDVSSTYQPEVMISDAANFFTPEEREKITAKARKQEFPIPGRILIYSMPDGEECEFKSNRRINPHERGLSEDWAFKWHDWENQDNFRSYISPGTIGICISEDSLAVNDGFFHFLPDASIEDEYAHAKQKTIAKRLISTLSGNELLDRKLMISPEISRHISLLGNIFS